MNSYRKCALFVSSYQLYLSPNELNKSFNGALNNKISIRHEKKYFTLANATKEILRWHFQRLNTKNQTRLQFNIGTISVSCVSWQTSKYFLWLGLYKSSCLRVFFFFLTVAALIAPINLILTIFSFRFYLCHDSKAVVNQFRFNICWKQQVRI